ncbi:MAG: hypothetical protein ACR2GH_00660 [Pseudonocardia sp.]
MRALTTASSTLPPSGSDPQQRHPRQFADPDSSQPLSPTTTPTSFAWVYRSGS